MESQHKKVPSRCSSGYRGGAVAWCWPSFSVGGRVQVKIDSPPQECRTGRSPVPPPDVVLLSDTTREVGLRLLNVAFVSGHKWKVSDGDSDLFVIMADVPFVLRVESNEETFSAGDLLRCELRTQQWQAPSGQLSNDHTIVGVIKHSRGPRNVPCRLAIDGSGWRCGTSATPGRAPEAHHLT